MADVKRKFRRRAERAVTKYYGLLPGEMGGGQRNGEPGMRCGLDAERETGNEVRSGYGAGNRE